MISDMLPMWLLFSFLKTDQNAAAEEAEAVDSIYPMNVISYLLEITTKRRLKAVIITGGNIVCEDL